MSEMMRMEMEMMNGMEWNGWTEMNGNDEDIWKM